MKPIAANDVTKLASGDWSKHLFMLDPSMVTLRYLSQTIDNSSGNIRTKGGLTLPPELWETILQCVASDIKKTPLKDKIPVQVSCLSSTPTRVLLRCAQVEVKIRLNYCLDNFTIDNCSELKEFMKNPAVATKNLQLFRPRRRTRQATQNLMDISFPIVLDNYPDRFPCLYWNITMPEFIFRHLDGYCGACDSDRAMACEQCDVGHPCSYIPCSVCMGPELIKTVRIWFKVVTPLIDNGSVVWSHSHLGDDEGTTTLVNTIAFKARLLNDKVDSNTAQQVINGSKQLLKGLKDIQQELGNISVYGDYGLDGYYGPWLTPGYPAFHNHAHMRPQHF